MSSSKVEKTILDDIIPRALDSLIDRDHLLEQDAIDIYLINYVSSAVYDSGTDYKSKPYEKFKTINDYTIKPVLASAVFVTQADNHPDARVVESLPSILIEEQIASEVFRASIDAIDNDEGQNIVNFLPIFPGYVYGFEGIDYLVGDGTIFFTEVNPTKADYMNVEIINMGLLNREDLVAPYLLKDFDIQDTENLIKAYEEMKLHLNDGEVNTVKYNVYTGYSLGAANTMNSASTNSDFAMNLAVGGSGPYKLYTDEFIYIDSQIIGDGDLPFNAYFLTPLFIQSLYVNTDISERYVSKQIIEQKKDFLNEEIFNKDFDNLYNDALKGIENSEGKINAYVEEKLLNEKFYDLAGEKVKKNYFETKNESILAKYIKEQSVKTYKLQENDSIILLASEGDTTVDVDNTKKFYQDMNDINEDENIELYLADKYLNIDLLGIDIATSVQLTHVNTALFYYLTVADQVNQWLIENGADITTIVNKEISDVLFKQVFKFQGVDSEKSTGFLESVQSFFDISDIIDSLYDFLNSAVQTIGQYFSSDEKFNLSLSQSDDLTEVDNDDELPLLPKYSKSYSESVVIDAMIDMAKTLEMKGDWDQMSAYELAVMPQLARETVIIETKVDSSGVVPYLPLPELSKKYEDEHNLYDNDYMRIISLAPEVL